MSKNKQNTPVPNKETYGRMNFLYQASMLMASQSNTTLSAYYARQCQSIGKKAQLKISPDVKRNFCKRCALAQQPGRTTDLEILPKKRKKAKRILAANETSEAHENIDFGADVFMKCRKCENKRKLIVNPNYDFWLEKTESTEEIKLQNTANVQSVKAQNNKVETQAKESTNIPKES